MTKRMTRQSTCRLSTPTTTNSAATLLGGCCLLLAEAFCGYCPESLTLVFVITVSATLPCALHTLLTHLFKLRNMETDLESGGRLWDRSGSGVVLRCVSTYQNANSLRSLCTPTHRRRNFVPYRATGKFLSVSLYGVSPHRVCNICELTYASSSSHAAIWTIRVSSGFLVKN